MLGIFGDPTSTRSRARLRPALATTALAATLVLAAGGLAPALAATVERPADQLNIGHEQQPYDVDARPARPAPDCADACPPLPPNAMIEAPQPETPSADDPLAEVPQAEAPRSDAAGQLKPPAADIAPAQPHPGTTTDSGSSAAAAERPHAAAASAATGYTVAVTSDPASGEMVNSGDDIGYTITAGNTGDKPHTGAVITVEMSGWQQAATLKRGSLKVSAGELRTAGSTLVWSLGELATGASPTLRYTITVNELEREETLVNVVSGAGDVPDSITTHLTPEYIKMVDPGPEIIAPEEGTAEQVGPGPKAKTGAEPTQGAAAGQGDESGEAVAVDPVTEASSTPTGQSTSARLDGTTKQDQGVAPAAVAQERLPETGTRQGMALAAGAGAAVLGAGAFLLFLARRRRAGASN